MPPKKYSVWSGRFTSETSPAMESFNRSFAFDQRLYHADIQCSIAYAKVLQRAGVLSQRECQQICKGLKIIEGEFDRGAFPVSPHDEDIHMAIERRLVELIGAPGLKLASGRSRNDQVVTDERYFLRETIDTVVSLIAHFQEVLVQKAEKEQTTLLPGYTHLQQAQPILLAHYLLSFFFALERDKNRFLDCRKRVNVMPLGSGAFAGNPYPIDQVWLAKELNFDEVTSNSIDAVSDRDALVEFIGASSILMTHLSRYAEDFIIWSTKEFGFLELDDAFTTGSSLMPQKKNPDALELIRGKAGRVFGHLSGILAAIKGVPLTYSKDLQEDKEPLFDTIDTITACLHIFTEVLRTMVFHQETMRAKIDPATMATDLADYLVQKGMPFRSSHHVIGELVRTAQEKKIPIDQLPLSEFKKQSDLFEKDVYSVFNPLTTVNKRKGYGGTAQVSIKRQLAHARFLLSKIISKERKKFGRKISK